MMRFKQLFVLVGSALFAMGLDAGVLSPIEVTGWEEDVVIGVGEDYDTGSTAQMDNPGAGSGATVWYGVGHNTSFPSTGLPTGLTQSETTEDLYFQLQSFTAANALWEGGTLTLVTPAAYTRIALLGATGQGTSDLTITLSYTTGEDDEFSDLGEDSVNHDWFGGSAIAYTADGRISTVSGDYDNVNSGSPRLYETFLAADGTRLLEFVTITDNATPDPETPHHSCIVALSGEGPGAVPEPLTALLMVLPLGALFSLRRRIRA